ncbi:hypothetical protein [uncultured Corynebacterium sp.]|uniref:hypothetical protein n=1 Tax=uncultured Corynebacterium sp. TaxID=159447 RepID=UPI0025CE8C8C|nr:hypothetical protein [uncultured Corynebacterium sp.]
MRNFRTAAVALATAATVAFGGTAIASAEEPTNNAGAGKGSVINSQIDTASSALTADNDASLSSNLAKVTDGYTDPTVTGQDLYGDTVADGTNPSWSKIWRESTYAVIGTAIAGAIIAAYNYAVYTHILPGHFLDPIFRG